METPENRMKNESVLLDQSTYNLNLIDKILNACFLQYLAHEVVRSNAYIKRTEPLSQEK